MIKRMMVWLVVIFVSWMGILAFKMTVAEPFEVPSGSMMPTLRIGDLVWVNKLAYGHKYPWETKMTINKTPSRGSVVVFIHPLTKEFFIKRVIGLPGDVVMILGRRVWINGVALETYEAKPDQREMKYWSRPWPNTEIRWASIKDPNHRYRVLWSDDQKSWDRSGYWVIPPSSLFVLGDWRDESSDSRSWGVVPLDNLIGEAVCVWDGGSRTGMEPNSQRSRCEIDGEIK